MNSLHPLSEQLLILPALFLAVVIAGWQIAGG